RRELPRHRGHRRQHQLGHRLQLLLEAERRPLLPYLVVEEGRARGAPRACPPPPCGMSPRRHPRGPGNGWGLGLARKEVENDRQVEAQGGRNQHQPERPASVTKARIALGAGAVVVQAMAALACTPQPQRPPDDSSGNVAPPAPSDAATAATETANAS